MPHPHETILINGVIRQRNWTEAELRAQGYEYYPRRKEVTMVRALPDSEAPKTVVTAQGDRLIAQKGYMICYAAGKDVHPHLDDYEQWPVAPEIFRNTYKLWDEAGWQPTPSQAKLLELGCTPYYKAAGVWAKPAHSGEYIQSKEHEAPIELETGKYVLIGAEGEPYSMGEDTLSRRYEGVKRGPAVLRWFKRLFRD